MSTKKIQSALCVVATVAAVMILLDAGSTFWAVMALIIGVVFALALLEGEG